MDYHVTFGKWNVKRNGVLLGVLRYHYKYGFYYEGFVPWGQFTYQKYYRSDYLFESFKTRIPYLKRKDVIERAEKFNILYILQDIEYMNIPELSHNLRLATDDISVEPVRCCQEEEF